VCGATRETSCRGVCCARFSRIFLILSLHYFYFPPPALLVGFKPSTQIYIEKYKNKFPLYQFFLSAFLCFALCSPACFGTAAPRAGWQA
jgi:hypothetical protein